MSAEVDDATNYTPATPLRLAVAAIAGPAWWAIHLGLTYLVVPEACELGIQWTLHLITVAMLAATAGTGAMTLGVLRRAGQHRDRDRYAQRDAYVAWLGMAMHIFFAAVIVAENLPRWFLDACW